MPFFRGISSIFTHCGLKERRLMETLFMNEKLTYRTQSKWHELFNRETHSTSVLYRIDLLSHFIFHLHEYPCNISHERIFLEQKKKKKWYTTDIFRTWMHFLRVNVTFYDAVNVIHDVITTANPFPCTAKFMFAWIRNNKTQQIRRWKIKRIRI